MLRDWATINGRLMVGHGIGEGGRRWADAVADTFSTASLRGHRREAFVVAILYAMTGPAEFTSPEAFYSQNLFDNSLRKKDSVVPLFQEEDNRLQFLGSGVHITVDNRFFLATADHIADACRRIITAFPSGSFRNLPTKRFYGYKQWVDVAPSTRFTANT